MIESVKVKMIGEYSNTDKSVEVEFEIAKRACISYNSLCKEFFFLSGEFSLARLNQLKQKTKALEEDSEHLELKEMRFEVTFPDGTVKRVSKDSDDSS